MEQTERDLRAEVLLCVAGQNRQKPSPECEIYMMGHPELWPYSNLPLVRDVGHDQDAGFLTEAEPAVSLGLMIGSLVAIDFGEKLVYGDWEELQADGWRVD